MKVPTGLRRFLAARFARRYLGLHLTIGFLVAVLALSLFFTLASEVLDGAAVVRVDRDVHDWIRSRATIDGYGWFGAITQLGSPPALVLLGAVGAAVFTFRRHWASLLVWGVAFLGGALLDLTLKMLVDRPRPPDASDYLLRASQSFPSGHAMMSTIGFGMTAYLFLVLRRRGVVARALVCGAMAVTIVLVGASRLYLGVHYVSDVLAGWVAGLAWLAVCVSGLEIVRRRGAVPESTPGPNGGNATCP